MKIGITERGDAGLDQSWRNAQVDGMILITKAPHLISDVPENAIIHCTITGYGGTKLEPGVAKPSITIQAAYKHLSTLGHKRTVLRVDPIIPTDKGIEKALSLIEGWPGRVRISFLDLYPHVIKRLSGIGWMLPWGTFNAPLEMRLEAYNEIKEICPQVEVCGEPDFPCTGCVSQLDLDALGLKSDAAGLSHQRMACACLGLKTELLSNRRQCKHGCLYCYWK